MTSLASLRRKAGVRGLLSRPDSNPKVAKNQKVGAMTAVLHLAPGNMSGHEVCPKRSAGCTAACLHYAGNPVTLRQKERSRIARTKLLFADRDLFMNILVMELLAHKKRADRAQMLCAVRLNGTSDIVWERKSFVLYEEVIKKLQREGIDVTDTKVNSVISLFPTITFYDYTAIPRRDPPSNYHLTFSAKETNAEEVAIAVRAGLNIAVVFGASLPAKITMGGVPLVVIDGDQHDFRPADPTQVVVGLRAKGLKASNDTTGFVQSNRGNTNSPRSELAFAA